MVGSSELIAFIANLSFIEVVNQKGENTINQNKANLVEAYSVVGAFHTIKGDYGEARENSSMLGHRSG